MKSPLPINAVLPELVDQLRHHTSLVLQAPTGAGKTTRVPPALLDCGHFPTGQILMLEPRRLAARASARRMASERNQPLGKEIGYHVRFDRLAGPHTKILVVTPGILLRQLQDNPFLENVSIVLFDEFHERGLETDLALGMVRLLQQTVRPDLRLVAMSATITAESVAHYLGNCPIVRSEGRLHPVAISYEPRSIDDPWSKSVAHGIANMLTRTDGDILAFLPGMQEIRHTATLLHEMGLTKDLLVLPLHGDLPPDEQDRALLPQAKRKVVLATNVAETSVTVEGVTGVVDCGLVRQQHFDPHVGLDRLLLTPIAKDSADQRSGRAGRTQPGQCIRLWSEANHRLRPEQTTPEIARVDLSGALLQLISYGESDLDNFPWLEPPPPQTVENAQNLLHRLHAIDDNGLTEMGRQMAKLPVHPRLARLLLEGCQQQCVERAAMAAALLGEREPFLRSSGQDANRPRTRSDLLDRVEVLEEFEAHETLNSPFGMIQKGAGRFILRTRNQLLKLLRQERVLADGVHHEPSHDDDDAFLRCVLSAFPDRVAMRRSNNPEKGLMVGGKGVVFSRFSGVTESPLVVCIDIEGSGKEALVRQASAIEKNWLSNEDIQTTTEVFYDYDKQQVLARQRVRYEDLLLDESPVPIPDHFDTGTVLVNALSDCLESVMPPLDSAAGQFLLRVRFLSHYMPNANLPSLEESDLKNNILPLLCRGCRSLSEVKKANWLGLMQSQFSYAQLTNLDREAPTAITLPSGKKVSLRYGEGKPPILACRIQELFGWRDVPRIAGGKVAIVLHLLAPNHRPQQITDDLASFWQNTYPQVRRDLRGRYPKHAWPEDPLTAMPQQRKRREV